MAYPWLRKRNKRYSFSPLTKLVCGIAIFFLLSCVCYTSLVKRLRSNADDHSENARIAAPYRMLRRKNLAESKGASQRDIYPETFIDLWPDDKHTEHFRNSLSDCLISTEQNSPCKVRYKEDSHRNKVQKVALMRTPGKLGNAFTKYVRRLIENYPNEGRHIDLVPTSHIIDIQHDYSKIIRFATLPILLEATDLALVSSEDVQAKDVKVTLDDLIGLVRQLVRWHCHLSQNTANTAFITITLDRWMGFPADTTRRLQMFLGLTPYENLKANRVDVMDELSLTIMDAINEGSSLVANVDLNVAVKGSIRQTIDAVIEEELASSHNSEDCRDVLRSVSSEGNSSITQVVGTFLSSVSSDSDSYCKKRKDSALCVLSKGLEDKL